MVAKELVVSTFSTLGGFEDDDETGTISVINDLFTPLSGYAFMAFCLLYVPCFATVGVIRQESNSWKWPVVMTAITLTTAYIVAFLIYNLGLLAGFG